jgi:hypothetical protein
VDILARTFSALEIKLVDILRKEVGAGLVPARIARQRDDHFASQNPHTHS